MGNLRLDWLRGSDGSPVGADNFGPHSSDREALDDNSLSLVLGGPIYQMYVRSRLLSSPIGMVRRRILVITAICWLPIPVLLWFTAGERSGTSFLSDVAAQVNLLAVLPLFIGSEVFVHWRIPGLIRQFVVRGIVAPEDRSRFERLVGSTLRLRNSITIEICLLATAFTLGYWTWINGAARGMNDWLGAIEKDRLHLSLAGYWYAFVSLPILRFLLLRWYYRLFLWYRFLWQVKGFTMRLNLFHPDRAAGLGFLSESVFAFSPILMAQTLAVAGVIANRILHAGGTLAAYKTEAVGAILFLMLLVMAPLGFFSGRLIGARHTARLELGALSSRYVDAFRRKWIKGDPGEPLLGSPDIQSLADIGNAFNTVTDMRIFPLGAKTAMRLAFIVAAPLAPLLLTVVPFEGAVKGLVKLVL